MGKKLLVGLISAAALIGMKFYNKASAHNDVKARLVELCEGDNQCVTAVNTHFQGCFDSAYKMGGRRQSSRLDSDALVGCVNSRAGKPYFMVASDKE
jgi:hypothetical protein